MDKVCNICNGNPESTSGDWTAEQYMTLRLACGETNQSVSMIVCPECQNYGGLRPRCVSEQQGRADGFGFEMIPILLEYRARMTDLARKREQESESLNFELRGD